VTRIFFEAKGLGGQGIWWRAPELPRPGVRPHCCPHCQGGALDWPPSEHCYHLAVFSHQTFELLFILFLQGSPYESSFKDFFDCSAPCFPGVSFSRVLTGLCPYDATRADRGARGRCR
jgi:hypothetical protein